MPRSASRSSLEPSCLYPGEPEIAQLVLGPTRSKMWPSLAIILEREGLPKINPQCGGRYWPKVREFLDRYEYVGHDFRKPVEQPGPGNKDRTGGVRPRPRYTDD